MTIEVFDMGDAVVCDWCGDDYTNSDRTGGVMFDSKAICPACEPAVRASAMRHGETDRIRAECPTDVTFARWVRETLRGGEPGAIAIYSGQDALDRLRGRKPS